MKVEKVYTSEIGRLYQNRHKIKSENAWVDELVENILEDLEYCIEVEGQELPIPAVLNKSRISLNMSKEDSDKVIHALKIKGVIARRHNRVIDDFFVVYDFL